MKQLFKKIEDMIIELDLIVNSRRKKEFNMVNF